MAPTAARESAPSVAISQKELDMLEELNSKGIEITVQPMPEISAISFDAVKRKM